MRPLLRRRQARQRLLQQSTVAVATAIVGAAADAADSEELVDHSAWQLRHFDQQVTSWLQPVVGLRLLV